jgi:hypothetical protein
MNFCYPNHFFLGNDWECKTFLPFFKLVKDTEMTYKFCYKCPLASYAHPLVKVDGEQYSYYKLCSLHVIKSGLLKLKDILKDKFTCNLNLNRNLDYIEAKKLLKLY